MRWPLRPWRYPLATDRQQHPEGTVDADTLTAEADASKSEVRVNKEYDMSGNLITCDSTCSSFDYSHNTDPALMDNLFRDFRPRFNMRFPFMIDPGFNDLFFRGTLLYPEFFQDKCFRGKARVKFNGRGFFIDPNGKKVAE